MTTFNSHVSVAIAACIVTSGPAFAHHPGGIGNSGGAGPINTISASTLDQGQTVAGVVVDYTRLNTLNDATLANAAANGVDGVHGLRSIAAYSTVLGYGVTKDVMVGLRLPYVSRTGIKAGELDPDTGDVSVLDHGSSRGFGDVTALGQYRFLNDTSRRFEMAALAGFIAPTGSTNRLSRQGELLDAEFQPGSGAWSGIFGLALTKRSGMWSFDTNVLYVATTEGTQRTDLGDQLLYNAAISYRLNGLPALGGGAVNAYRNGPMFHGAVPHDHGADGHAHSEPATSSGAGLALDLVLELNGEQHAKQQVSGVKDLNSGGNVVYVAPGLRLSHDKWSAFVSVGVPVYKDLSGLQPEPDVRVRSGVAVAF